MTLRTRSGLLALLAASFGACDYAWAQQPGRARSNFQPATPATQPAHPSRRGIQPVTPTTNTTNRPQPGLRSGPERPLVEFDVECQGEPWGQIVIELYPERTPTTVRNFLHYVETGFYDGTIFHRVVPDFLIQGGGYVSLTEAKTEGLQGPIRNESRRAPKNTRGTIGIARKRDPHSATSQFYINVADNATLDYPKAGDYGYCVFGTVIDGMDVVDRIKSIPTQVSPEAEARFAKYKAEGKQVEHAEQSQPINPPVLKKARRLERAEYEQRKAPGGAAEVPPPPATTQPSEEQEPEPPT